MSQYLCPREDPLICGRFGASFQYRDIKVLWNLQGDFTDFAPRYNIAPSQDVPVIVRNEGRNEMKPMRWGLVPSWAPDHSIGQRMTNASAETLLEKPSFRQLVATRRCLVPADGFYEWRREGRHKVPMWIHLKNGKPFAFAGLWDYWRDPAGDKELYSFTIITTEANALLRPIHNRMPVIYDKEMGEAVAGGELWRPADDSARRVAAVADIAYGSSRSFNTRQFT